MADRKESAAKEVSFLPPLKMILSFFDQDAHSRERLRVAAEKKKKEEAQVVKLIEKLSEKEKQD